MTVPIAMVFLPLILAPRTNRWLNILFGTIYSLMMLAISVSSRGEWLIELFTRPRRTAS